MNRTRENLGISHTTDEALFGCKVKLAKSFSIRETGYYSETTSKGFLEKYIHPQKHNQFT